LPLENTHLCQARKGLSFPPVSAIDGSPRHFDLPPVLTNPAPFPLTPLPPSPLPPSRTPNPPYPPPRPSIPLLPLPSSSSPRLSIVLSPLPPPLSSLSFRPSSRPLLPSDSPFFFPALHDPIYSLPTHQLTRSPCPQPTPPFPPLLPHLPESPHPSLHHPTPPNFLPLPYRPPSSFPLPPTCVTSLSSSFCHPPPPCRPPFTSSPSYPLLQLPYTLFPPTFTLSASPIPPSSPSPAYIPPPPTLFLPFPPPRYPFSTVPCTLPCNKTFSLTTPPSHPFLPNVVPHMRVF